MYVNYKKHFSHTDKDLVKLIPLVTHHSVVGNLPFDLLSPSTFCKSVMWEWAGFAPGGNDGIG